MGEDYKSKGVGFLKRKGTSEKKPVIDERDGSVGGYHLEKWDDSQDAVVNAKAVRRQAKKMGDEDR